MIFIALDFITSNSHHTEKDIAEVFFTFLKDKGILEKVLDITLDNAVLYRSGCKDAAPSIVYRIYGLTVNRTVEVRCAAQGLAESNWMWRSFDKDSRSSN